MSTQSKSLARIVRAAWERAAKWPSPVHGALVGVVLFLIAATIWLANVETGSVAAVSAKNVSPPLVRHVAVDAQQQQQDANQVEQVALATPQVVTASDEHQVADNIDAHETANLAAPSNPAASGVSATNAKFEQAITAASNETREAAVGETVRVIEPAPTAQHLPYAVTPATPPTATVARAAANKDESHDSVTLPDADWRTLTKSRQQNEEQLRAYLAVQSTELDLDSIPKTSEKIWKETSARTRKRRTSRFKKSKRNDNGLVEFHPLHEQLAARTDLSGLPMQMGEECHMEESLARKTQAIAGKVRALSTAAKQKDRSGNPKMDDIAADYYLARKIHEAAKENNWFGTDSMPALVQMLQVEGEETRMMLIKLLSSMKSDEADLAIAKRALFDLSPMVRQAAIDELGLRQYGKFRDVILDGFRHPWPPAANHAAEALVQIDDHGALKQLVDLLDKPNPAGPYVNDEGQVVQRELVRVNHMRNCLMCHAPSLATNDPLRGLAPTPGQPLPVVYYQSMRGNFVRADVTYLKQDFSVMHPVEKAAPWPKMQRYDYFVREQPLTRAALKELAVLLLEQSQQDQVLQSLNNRKGRESYSGLNELVAVLLKNHGDPSFPQREAALVALRKMTGVNVGDSSAAWRNYVDSMPELN